MRPSSLLPSAACSIAALAALLLPLAARAQSVEVTGSVISRNANVLVTPTPNPTASWTYQDILYVGNSTTEAGSISVTGGGIFNSSNVNVGRYSGSVGTITVSGAGSTWTSDVTPVIGLAGKGSLHITDGGTVSHQDSYIAHSSGSEGEATVSGAGSKWTTRSLSVGNAGKGKLSITDGGLVSVHNGFIGYNNGAEGEAIVSGAGSRWEVGNLLYLGGTSQWATTGQGKLTIENGGTVTVGETTRVYAGDSIDILDTGALETGTLISNGTVNVFGTLTAANGVTVQSGGEIGGGGEIVGDLTLLAGAKFQFIPGSPLSVTGNVTLDSSFGVADLLGLSSDTATGTYMLIDTTAASFSLLTIQNWGIDNAYDLGGGKSAYFREGSLILEVIPEPATYAIFVQAAVAGFCLVSRRKRRA